MPKPILVKLSELKPGQLADFFVQLSEKKPGTTRDGKPYFTCRFRDGKRNVGTAPIWCDGPWFEECDTRWAIGEFYKIRGVITEHERYGQQLEIEQIRETNERDKSDGFDEGLFRDGSRFDPEVMFVELTGVVEEIKDEPLRALVLLLLNKHAERVKTMPATATKFYPFPGGWLEHTLSVSKSCAWLADKYIERYRGLKFNRDLVIAGAVLHDLGRLLEADVKILGLPPEPNRGGHLLGQHFLAFAALREAGREVPNLEPELLELLEHIVIAHLTRPEWGSPRLPAIPEVLIIHHADDLDAKFEMYARCLERDASDGPFTARDPVLGRELLKDRKF